MNSNSKLDVHRLVTFLGYKFNDKVTFVSELEYEHVVELYVEQAFLDYKIKDNMSLCWFDAYSHGDSKFISRTTNIQWC